MSSMQSTGVVYLGNAPPLATTAADGTFNLTLLVADRHGMQMPVGWRITWTGAEAQAWHRQYADKLPPGTALRVDCIRIRSHNLGRFGQAEIHAQVAHCALAATPHRAPFIHPAPRKALCTS